MPAEQHGEPYRTQKGWGLRYYTEGGQRRRQSGFPSRSAALAWFRNVELKRQRGETPTVTPPTLSEHVETYLAAHSVGRDAKTIDVLRFRLAYATRTFGDLRLDELERRVPEIAAWTTTLPVGSRYGIVQAFRQTMAAAVRWNLVGSNPIKAAGSNPPPQRDEVVPFEPHEVEAIADELGRTYGPLVIVGAYCGLRPSELIALEWRDVDRADGVLRVERAYSYGVVKTPKTKGSRRRVPLPARAAEALETIGRRIDTRLVFPGPRGSYIDQRNWRKREWKPALEAAGLPRARRPYDLRHSYAAWSLAAGVPAHDLARYMGTSLRMIDLTYGHLVRGSEEAARTRLDAFTTAAAEAAKRAAQ
jgi:integrase